MIRNGNKMRLRCIGEVSKTLVVGVFMWCFGCSSTVSTADQNKNVAEQNNNSAEKKNTAENKNKEKLIALDSCDIVGNAIEPKCEAFVELRKLEQDQAFRSEVPTLAKELITHSAPQVRLQSARYLATRVLDDEGVSSLYFAALSKENNASVYAAMIRFVGSLSTPNEEIRAGLFAASVHRDSSVRKAAAEGLLHFGRSKMDEANDKIFEMLISDNALSVRSFICSRLNMLDDDRIFEAFDKYLGESDTPEELNAACAKGLVKTWAGYVRPKEPSKVGYLRTMRLLEQTPRTNKTPDWSAISLLRSLSAIRNPKNKADAAWGEKLSTFYEPKRIEKRLQEIVVDVNASEQSRTASVRVLGDISTNNDFIKSITKKYASYEEGPEYYIRRQSSDILSTWALNHPADKHARGKSKSI